MVSLTPAEQQALGNGPRKWGPLFAAVWLFYLLSPLHAAWNLSEEWRRWAGIGLTLAFAGAYMSTFLAMRSRRPGTPFRSPLPLPWRAAAIATQLGLGVLMCAVIGQDGDAAAVYVAVTGAICLQARWAWLSGIVLAVGTYTATLTLPGWHRDDTILFGILVATLAVWGVTQAIDRNIEVLAMREDNARLQVAEERNRFARDLHDILGHSLTVITVKAELANRLVDVDADRARAELADLERLSRDALADVRRAVQGYREISLPGELARARAALTAAEIEAELPSSADEVPSDLRELFAWVVREGVTNVIKHSHARRCRVVLSPREVEVRDDGDGPVPGPRSAGHGLAGLAERASAVGASVVTTVLEPGFSLKVAVPQ